MAGDKSKRKAPSGAGGGAHKRKKGGKQYAKPEPRLTPKELRLKRQQSRPHYDTVSKAKEIWNRLREKELPAFP